MDNAVVVDIFRCQFYIHPDKGKRFLWRDAMFTNCGSSLIDVMR